MPTNQSMLLELNNELLRNRIAAAYDAGDMETAFKLSALLDEQQICLLDARASFS